MCLGCAYFKRLDGLCPAALFKLYMVIHLFRSLTLSSRIRPEENIYAAYITPDPLMAYFTWSQAQQNIILYYISCVFKDNATPSTWLVYFSAAALKLVCNFSRPKRSEVQCLSQSIQFVFHQC